MLDIRLIRKDRESLEARLKTKDPSIDLSSIVALDEEIRDLKTQVEKLKSERNELSEQIGRLKRDRQNADSLMQEATRLSEEITGLDHAISAKEETFNRELASIPNVPMEGIKVSLDPKDNVVIKTFGERCAFSFPSKNHVELSEKHALFDFKRGAKISGSGWPTYRGIGARLEWALLNYMIDIQIKNGFELWMVPLLVRQETMFASGQLPKFEHQLFKITDKDYNLYLVPTAEVALNGLHTDEILEEEALPLKYTSFTPCFRREAGAAGSQERGLIRTHQFHKVEMFSFVKPEESEQMFETMLNSASEVLEGLGLHYRQTLLVTGDQSFGAAKTVDVEVFLPGQDRYYEVSSVSNCTDYQARRSNARFRRKGGKPEFLHTLNGSGLATSRLMVALLENNQQEDGSIIIPEVLRSRLGGLEVIQS
ncbi:MAG: serS [Chlamydiales bacterium]|jgi:seryl-tRNA synthetase|nr:serS [Chlamydiales bacterium]